jgi:diadenosine tetraphosphate (Ap4A) HIT family hydrolase
VVLGDVQFLQGYSLLLPDPVVPDLNALTMENRITFLKDMTVLGDALLEVTGAVRINYEILGNREPALHAHVFPRFSTEPEEQRRKPVWFYDRKSAPPFDSKQHQQLMSKIAATIKRYQKIM